MNKSNYKKISRGNARSIKRDLDVLSYLSHHYQTKRWMKKVLNRYNRRRNQSKDLEFD